MKTLIKIIWINDFIFLIKTLIKIMDWFNSWKVTLSYQITRQSSEIIFIRALSLPTVFIHHSLFINHHTLFIIHYSSYIIDHWSFIIHQSSYDSLFIIEHWSFVIQLFIIHYSSFIIHHSIFFLFYHLSFLKYYYIIHNFYIYKVATSVYLIVCPMITQKPVDRFFSNFDWVLRLVLIF